MLLRFVERNIRKAEESKNLTLWEAVSWPLKMVFGAIVKGRNFFYEKRIFKKRRSPLPVVSIGNIVSGGVGKTPLTLKLARELSRFSKVAIVSRGYRGKAEKKKVPLLVSDGKGLFSTPEECGDEVYLLATRVPEAIVIASKDRFKGVVFAKEKGARVVVLDDGLQHRKLERDIEIVMVNEKKPFGGKFLPTGFLRDDPKRLDDATHIVVNGEKIGEELKAKFKAPLIRGKMEFERATFFDGSEVWLKGKKVGIFSGIANPERFNKSVTDEGADIVLSLFLGDHEKIENNRLKGFAMDAKKKGATMLLCTEKDWVKCKLLDDLALPIAYVRSSFEIKENQESWDELIEGLRKTLA